MPVDELLDRISSAELSEWMAYEDLTGPLGQERLDQLVAMLSAVTANAMRSRKRPYPVRDFLPPWSDNARREQSVDEQLAVVTLLNQAFGGVDLRGNDRDPPDPDGRQVHRRPGPRPGS